MADEPIISSGGVTPSGTVGGNDGAAPAATAPVVADAAPVAAPAPAAPAAAAESPKPAETKADSLGAQPAADAPVQPPKSLLSEAIAEKKPEPVKAEAPPPTETKPAEIITPQGEKIAWEYTIPETFELDDKGRERVNDAFEKFAANPRDKANQQALVDYHVEQQLALKTKLDDFNRNFWAETRKNWRGEIMSDEQLGGAGHQTVSAAVARMVDLGVPEKQRPAFEEMIELTGVGDHPAFWRMLHNLARFYDESPQPPQNINPPKDIGRPPGQRGRLQYKSMDARR